MLSGGFALAVAATLAVFLTDNPELLRLAVVGVAWAFVLATFAAGRRSTDQVAAQAREAELRQAYEYELEREIADRREYELQLEAEVRSEAEESMRAELDALRQELARLTDLRDEVARVADLRTDISALSALRDEVARVAALRDDVAALSSLRQDLGQLGDLRADMGRLRQELSEQLSSEMLVERIVMRTQAGRLGTDLTDAPGRAMDAATRWAEDAPPRELTGGWPAIRLDEPRETRQFEQVRVERAAARPPVPPPSWRPSWESEPAGEVPATPSWEQDRWSPSLEDRWSAPAPSGSGRHPDEQVPPTTSFPQAPPFRGLPPTTANPVVVPPAPEPLPSPMEWLAARSLPDAEPTSFRPEVPPRRRRAEEAPAPSAEAPTAQRPAVPANPPVRIDQRDGYRVAVPAEPPADRPAKPSPEKRLSDILAENGVTPSTGGRRRHRYRTDDEPDDVLARILRND